MAIPAEYRNGNAYVGGDGSESSVFIGLSATEKVSFYGVSAVAQPAHADQADQGVMTTIGANTGTSGAGLSLIGDTSTVNQATNLMNDLAALQEDIAALDAVVTQIRTALVDLGLMKGSA